MTDLSVLQSRVARLAQRSRTDAERNREKAPEFARFVDDFKSVFGDAVRVRWVRWADGSEQGQHVFDTVAPAAPPPAPAARRSDPATSKAAARAAATFVSEHHQRILDALDFGCTCHELAALTGLDHVAIARRLPELEAAGRVRKTGKTRPAANGRQCTVWERVE